MQIVNRILSSLLILAMLVYGTSASARFMGADPEPPDAANVHSFNRYAYGNNNPYRFVDPDGRSPVDWFNLAGFFNNPFAQASVAAPGSGTQEMVTTSVNNVAADVKDMGKTAAVIVGTEMATAGTAAAVPALIRAARLAEGIDGVGETSVITKQVLGRKALGADGAKSVQIIERENRKMISRTHEVTKDGKTLHLHQNHTGKYGGERQFPDEWTGTKTIDAPYENVPPSFPAERVPGGRTF